jgi:hypothetical protein
MDRLWVVSSVRNAGGRMEGAFLFVVKVLVLVVIVVEVVVKDLLDASR